MIAQHFEFPSEHEKYPKLAAILGKEMDGRRILIFSETKRNCDELTRRLRQDGYPALSIHGDKQQKERDWVLAEFKSGKHPIMIATDVAARGLGEFRALFLFAGSFAGSLGAGSRGGVVFGVSGLAGGWERVGCLGRGREKPALLPLELPPPQRARAPVGRRAAGRAVRGLSGAPCFAWRAAALLPACTAVPPPPLPAPRRAAATRMAAARAAAARGAPPPSPAMHCAPARPADTLARGAHLPGRPRARARLSLSSRRRRFNLCSADGPAQPLRPLRVGARLLFSSETNRRPPPRTRALSARAAGPPARPGPSAPAEDPG
jgi:hypothetical protein